MTSNYYADDCDKDDPREAEDILAEELQKMSFAERNAFQEEVHGVRTLAIDETPELLAEKLQLLAFELDVIILDDEKQAYLRSQQFPNTYVNTDSFRLRILRSSLWDPVWSARRIVTFLECAAELFGEIALQRPIRMSDFTKDELRILRSGCFQFLPFGDRSGRRILMIFPNETWEAMGKLRPKISMYMSWSAGDDINTQRNGIVFLVWFSESFKVSQRPLNVINDRHVHTTRAAAIHVFSPDTPLFRFRRAVISMRLAYHRRILKIHIGNPMEHRYAVQGFGVPIDHIPISYAGKIKTGYIKKWINVRDAIEQSETFGGNEDPALNNIIEYPQSNDVVFRQGSSSKCHPANIAFRSLIETKLREQENAREKFGTKIKRRKLVLDIIQATSETGGRFLIWNEVGGWNELVDHEQIYAKIEYLMKEFRKTLKLNRSNMQQKLKSETSIFRNATEESITCESSKTVESSTNSECFQLPFSL